MINSNNSNNNNNLKISLGKKVFLALFIFLFHFIFSCLISCLLYKHLMTNYEIKPNMSSSLNIYVLRPYFKMNIFSNFSLTETSSKLPSEQQESMRAWERKESCLSFFFFISLCFKTLIIALSRGVLKATNTSEFSQMLSFLLLSSQRLIRYKDSLFCLAPQEQQGYFFLSLLLALS